MKYYAVLADYQPYCLRCALMLVMDPRRSISTVTIVVTESHACHECYCFLENVSES